ncbi:hypothetical protein [Croceimicrobium hydrocarbonivorans]|uniref:Uncharacterized protein n=1 Tax=Croceimicrobium hydrocarbonivorans TaxID=2761580 RepID=A0A7H0VIW8_9FLAO|nr:hypothetical protein [Croceimicrobium hydrocarbonivorans]QNR25666.1 hypothetical protein H4K34_07445 [Croceimicrobium hydrocarbonivorans]
MRYFHILLLIIPITCLSQKDSELICYSNYSITDKSLDGFLGEQLRELSACLNDSVVLSFTVYTSSFKNSTQIDTNIALEIAPLFTWGNVGRNYYGVTKVDGVMVFIRENERELFLQILETDTCVSQKVIGVFDPEFNESSTELPNSIYQSIKCYYRIENGVFVLQGRKCECIE